MSSRLTEIQMDKQRVNSFLEAKLVD